MKRNVELFEKVAFAIEKYPAQYDQASWSKVSVHPIWSEGREPTVTVRCIGGWAIALSGYVVLDRGRTGYFGMGQKVAHTADTPAVEGIPWGAWPDEVASILLGLYEDEMEALFASDWIPPFGKTVSETLLDISRGERVPRTFSERQEGRAYD